MKRLIGNTAMTALTLLLSQAAAAALVAGSVLNFDAPQLNSSGQVIGGSNFAVDFTSDGVIDIIERTPLYQQDGLIIGVAQASGPGAGIDQPWQFFGQAGVHFTTAPVNVLSDDGSGNIQLDMSGWMINWNGIDIGLGGASWGSNPNGVGIMTCGSTCGNGDSFSLFYTATVTEGPFLGVRYRLGFDSGVLAASGFEALGSDAPGFVTSGTISAVPLPAASWLFGSALLALLGVVRRRG